MSGLGRRMVARLLLTAVLAGCAAEPYDVLIVGGTVVDGTGSDGFAADVGIRDGYVAEVAEPGSLGGKATELIDASGKLIAPGFIDSHSHAADGLADTERAHAEALLLQGVTTVILNPDGSGALDLDRQRSEISAARPGVNFAQFAAHGTIRTAVLGLADRAPDSDELEQMKEHVRTAMHQGAVGLSSGPFYAPGSFSDTSELIEMAAVVSEEGGGAYQSHIRDESTYSVGLLAAVQEVIDVAERAEVRGVVTHIKALGPQVWGLSSEVIERIDAARSRGVQIFADQYPYEASATGLAAALVPRWAQEGGPEAMNERLADPALRERVVQEMALNLERRGGPQRIVIRQYEAEPELAGQKLSDISESRGQGTIETAIELISKGYVGIVSFNMDLTDIDNFAAKAWTMTASDGGLPNWGVGVPHPRSFGTFPRKLRRFALERSTQSLPEAVRSMTGLPSSVYGLAGRGVLLPGSIADVVIIDPESLSDEATFEQPFQLSQGITHVFIAGQLVVEEGKANGLRAGVALRRSTSP